MIEITNDIQSDFPKAFAKAEKEKPWVTRKGDNEWRVVPRKLKDGSREHGKYVVRIVQWGSRMFADCVNVITGETCEGHNYKGCCYHISATLLHVERQARRNNAHLRVA